MFSELEAVQQSTGADVAARLDLGGKDVHGDESCAYE